MQCLNRPTISTRCRWLPAAACTLLMATLCACGGGSSMSSMASMSASTPPASAAPAPSATTSSCSVSTCGMALTTITDAAGDFLSYQVNLVSLQLEKSDGTLVETLPATTQVDFAQLVDLTEIISARQIPPGDYVAAQVTVDFTNATIIVDDGTGNGIAVKPVDSNGGPLGQLQLTVQFDNRNDLKINAAKASRIAFDFNLLASNMVDLSAQTDTVSPALVASVIPIDNKAIRVRGCHRERRHGRRQFQPERGSFPRSRWRKTQSVADPDHGLDDIRDQRQAFRRRGGVGAVGNSAGGLDGRGIRQCAGQRSDLYRYVSPRWQQRGRGEGLTTSPAMSLSGTATR